VATIPVAATRLRESIAMSDLAIAGMLFTFLVALAIAAPIWGYDSRDGVESDQSARRVSWLYDRPIGQGPCSTSVAVAGALRTVAYRLDAQAAASSVGEQRLAEAC
jgi:hypothetical protein